MINLKKKATIIDLKIHKFYKIIKREEKYSIKDIRKPVGYYSLLFYIIYDQHSRDSRCI